MGAAGIILTGSSRNHRNRLDHMSSLRRLRISEASIGPNLLHQYLTAS
jgi:hypothetical protein